MVCVTAPGAQRLLAPNLRVQHERGGAHVTAATLQREEPRRWGAGKANR